MCRGYDDRLGNRADRQAQIADVARGCCSLHDYRLGAETVRRNAQFEPALVGQHDGELSACIRELGPQQSAAGRDYPCVGDRPVVGIDDAAGDRAGQRRGCRDEEGGKKREKAYVHRAPFGVFTRRAS